MKTTLEHRAKLKEILDYAFNYALGAMEWEGEPQAPADWSAEIGLHFYSKSNEGFKKAQKLLIEERTDYQQQLRDATSQLKKARGLRIKPDVERLGLEINVIETRLSVLAHIADGIAWILLGGQIHRARRLHMQETEQKFLDSSNVAHAIKTADAINENPLDFALLSDIGGIVQIGDLLVRRPTSVEIIELKEGNVNDTITKLFDTAEQAGQNIANLDLGMLDTKTVKQAQRMMRQRVKKANSEGLITNDIGIDPVTGRPMAISTPLIETEQYHEELASLRTQLKTKNSAYTLIEGCLHIGMYRGESTQTMAPVVIEHLLKTSTSDYKLLDWLDIIDQVAEPIFAKSFDQEFILDFLTGQVKVIMGLDFNALIKTLNVFGLEAEWMTVKETARLKSENNIIARQMVTNNNKGIKLTVPTHKDMIGTLGGGIVSKILFDNIYPSNIALTMLNSVRPKLPGIDD